MDYNTFNSFAAEMGMSVTKEEYLQELIIQQQQTSSVEEWQDIQTQIDELAEEDEEWDGQPDEAQEWYDFDPDC